MWQTYYCALGGFKPTTSCIRGKRLIARPQGPHGRDRTTITEAIGGPSIHWGGGARAPKFYWLYWGGGTCLPPTFLEFSIGQAKNSNSSNGGAPQKNFGYHFVPPPKISGHGPPMIEANIKIPWNYFFCKCTRQKPSGIGNS